MTLNKPSQMPVTELDQATTPVHSERHKPKAVSVGRALSTFIPLSILLLILAIGVVISLFAMTSTGLSVQEWSKKEQESDAAVNRLAAALRPLDSQFYKDSVSLDADGFYAIDEWSEVETNIEGIYYRWGEANDADWGNICPADQSCVIAEVKTNSFATCSSGIQVRLRDEAGIAYDAAIEQAVHTNELVRIGVGVGTDDGKSEMFELAEIRCV